MGWGNSGETPAAGKVAGDRRTAAELAGGDRNFRPTHLLDRKAPKPSTSAEVNNKENLKSPTTTGERDDRQLPETQSPPDLSCPVVMFLFMHECLALKVELYEHQPFFQLQTAPNQVATVRCGSCQMTLMYPYGAPSVKCAVCHFVTNVGVSIDFSCFLSFYGKSFWFPHFDSANGRASNPVNRPHGPAYSSAAPSSASATHLQSQTVVVENPMSFDASGKLVSNVVVGVTTEKK
ncbi:hypothetical protein Cgig2_029295 [Carnegiea gigantea]|uniref:Zinc finger LSD1-type domain-containing protein n=1 Tax=Carnegiea gigantea TaxID=171969 RepID=A0A9Q1KUS1_9CARY|nr:hypothetical protein Cgig2_029295 [Carnegiea gigantea]